MLQKWYMIIVIIIIIILSHAARKSLIHPSCRPSGDSRGMTTERTNRRMEASLSTPPRCFPGQPWSTAAVCNLRLSVFDRRMTVEPRSHAREREREMRVNSTKANVEPEIRLFIANRGVRVTPVFLSFSRFRSPSLFVSWRCFRAPRRGLT